jgi:hypothetical protein
MPPDGTNAHYVSLWELPSFYRRLKASVVALENAWEQGHLESALLDEEVTGHLSRSVVRTYERLVGVDDLRHSSFRRDSIHAVLTPVKELLSAPRIWFEVAARMHGPQNVSVLPLNTVSPDDDPASEDEEPAESALEHVTLPVLAPGGEVRMAMHQMVSARFWGIGFEFEGRNDEQLFVNLLLRDVLDRLAVDLGDLMHVQRWYTSRPRGGPQPVIVPDPAGRRYEQLMLDILNEERRCARRARLSEDFLEKTDVRVKVDGVKRRRGARVQVTQTTHPDFLAQKRALIRRVNEYVILSPLPLAEAMTDERIGEFLRPPERYALWESFPEAPTTIPGLAMAFKRIFLDTLDRSPSHPTGPMHQIPKPIRQLVRAYVTAEAHRTTSEMRARHAAAERVAKR